MKRFACSVLGILVAATPVVAQDTVIAVKRDSLVGTVLQSNTEVLVSLNQGITTKGVQVGDTFPITVSRDVMLGDYVVIPRGTPGHGRISYRTGKGAFGKSAKMEFDVTDVEVGGRSVPLSGHYRIEGQGNTGATVGAVVAVGVFGAFVTGHSATASQDSEWKAYTKEPLNVAFASAPSNSSAPTASGVSPGPSTSAYEAGRRAGQAAALAANER